jgi:hypothetical protein
MLWWLRLPQNRHSRLLSTYCRSWLSLADRRAAQWQAQLADQAGDLAVVQTDRSCDQSDAHALGVEAPHLVAVCVGERVRRIGVLRLVRRIWPLLHRRLSLVLDAALLRYCAAWHGAGGSTLLRPPPRFRPDNSEAARQDGPGLRQPSVSR